MIILYAWRTFRRNAVKIRRRRCVLMNLNETEWISLVFNEIRLNLTDNKRKLLKLSRFRLNIVVFVLIWLDSNEI